MADYNGFIGGIKMKLKKGMKLDGTKGTIEVVDEFVMATTIKKGTKAVICKEGNKYFVCNANR